MQKDGQITIVAIVPSATICLLHFIGCFVHDSVPQVSQLSVHFIGCFVHGALPKLSRLPFFTSLAVSFTQVSSSGHGDAAGGCSTFASSWVVWSWPQMWIQRPARTTALPRSLLDLKMLRIQAMFWMMPWGIFPPTSSQMLGIQANDRAMLSLGRSTDRTPT